MPSSLGGISKQSRLHISQPSIPVIWTDADCNPLPAA